jgi:hypothetical protein
VPGGQSFRLFLEEGVLVGCLSADPLAVEHALDVAENRRASAAIFARNLRSASRCAVEQSPDHGWMSAMGWGRNGILRSPILWFQLDNLTPDEVAGRVCSPVPLWDPVPPPAADELAGVGRLYGDLPMAFCAIEARWLPGVLDALAPDKWTAALGPVLAEVGTAPICFAVVGGDYSGQYLEMKVPGLLAAVRMRDQESGREAMRQCIDRLNQSHHWGLYLRDVLVGDRLAQAVETSRDTPFARLGLEERPAFALCDGWLVMGSSLKSLRAVLARYDRSESAEAVARGAWLPGAARHPMYAWFKLTEFAKSIRTAVKFHRLKTLHQTPPDRLTDRNSPDTLLAWLDVLAALPLAEVWIGTSARETVLQFRLGTRHDGADTPIAD